MKRLRPRRARRTAAGRRTPRTPRGRAAVCGLALLLPQLSGCLTSGLMRATHGGGTGVVEPPVRVYLTDGGEMVGLARTTLDGENRAWEAVPVEDLSGKPGRWEVERYPLGSQTLTHRPAVPPAPASAPVTSSSLTADSPWGVVPFFRHTQRERFPEELTPAEAQARVAAAQGPGRWLEPLDQPLGGSGQLTQPLLRVYPMEVDGVPDGLLVFADTPQRVPPEPIPLPLRVVGLPFAVAGDVVLLPAYLVAGVVVAGTVLWVYRDGG